MVLLAGLAGANEYEVQLGDQSYLVVDGEAKMITLPNGDEMKLVVTRSATLMYEGEDLSFSYSSDMKVSDETEMGVQTITAECENSTLFLGQVYPMEISEEEAVDALMGGMLSEFAGFGATFPADHLTASERMVGGKLRHGKRLKFSLGDLRHETEIYAWHKGTQTITVVFQAAQEDREVAEKYFKIIADSIR